MTAFKKAGSGHRSASAREALPPSEPADEGAGARTPGWLSVASVHHYRRGQAVIELGSPLPQWLAVREGVLCMSTRSTPDAEVPVALLWFGDVIGWTSPIGKEVARYDVTALSPVSIVSIPRTNVSVSGAAADLCKSDAFQLFAATAARIQDQVSLRLSGNGLQRLIGVLATLARATLGGATPQTRLSQTGGLPLPMSQSLIGSLAGLARRQTWVYLGQLAEAGWVSTGHAKLILQGAPAWLRLLPELERGGLAGIATIEDCHATLSRLWLAQQAGTPS